MMARHEIHKLKSQTFLLKIAAFSAFTLGAMFLAGSYGFGAGKHVQYKRDIATVKQWVETADFPVVKIVYASHEPIAIIRGNVCTPIGPGYRLPATYRIEWVSPYDRPCGTGKPGQPYQDSAALAAITNRIRGIN